MDFTTIVVGGVAGAMTLFLVVLGAVALYSRG